MILLILINYGGLLWFFLINQEDNNLEHIPLLSYRTIHFANYTAVRFRALVIFDCFVLMTMISRNLLRGAWARIYNFTTYKAHALRNSTGQSHSCRRFENPVVDSSPCSFLLPPYPSNSGSRSYILQTLTDRTDGQTTLHLFYRARYCI